jgi:hypothetical protein
LREAVQDWKRLLWLAPVVLAVAGLVGAVAYRASGRADAGEPPEDEVEIPADVPERLVLPNKDGTTTEVGGREFYARCHRRGWAEFWPRYKRGELDPHDEAADIGPEGEPREASEARRAGFEACRRMVLRSAGE